MALSNEAITKIAKWICLALLLVVAVPVWYFTIGRKPKLVLKAPLKEVPYAGHIVGKGEYLVVSSQEAILYDMGTGKAKWTSSLANVKAAAAPPAIDFRIQRLQAWAKELATKRAALKTPEEIQAFNKEAAAYHAELTATRSGQGGNTQVPPAATPVAAAPKAAAPKPPVSDDPPEMIRARLERQFEHLAQWDAELSHKRQTAKSPIQLSSLTEETARYEKELSEAKAEQAKLTAASQPVTSQSLAAQNAAAQSAAAQRSMMEDDTSFSGGYDFQSPSIEIGPQLIWVVVHGEAIGLDRATGKAQRAFTFHGHFHRTQSGDGCFFLLTDVAGSTQVTRVKFDDNSVSTLATPASPRDMAFTYSELGSVDPIVATHRTVVSPAGNSLALLDITLVEQKVIERDAMKATQKEDWEKWDKESTNGGMDDAAKLTNVLANDAAREQTGGKEHIDQSTYSVKLIRAFGDSVPEWTGQVQGRPELFSSDTLDFVTAGTTLIAFDRKNQKLWETHLGQTINLQASFGEDYEGKTHLPCLEHGDRLYLYDRGFLTAFERRTGNVLWRIPSIGIYKIQVDSAGMLYVFSENAAAESLRYVYQARQAGEPVFFKVDPAKGKILWKVEGYQDGVVSNSSVYVTRESRNGEDAVNNVFDRKHAIETRFKLYKLSARDGKAQWEWFQTHHPTNLEADGRKVTLMFRNELQVLKSIAL